MFVEISGLNFKYKNAKEDTLKDVNISIEQGETIAILGESGSGKSTILRLLAGLEVPSSGRIKIDDRVMVDDHTFMMPEKRGVGMVFQDYALFPHMTVAENVKFGLKGLTKKEKQQRLKEVLLLVGLDLYGGRYPYELSGGQQQRVALARSLAPNPSVLLMDEPFSNLDANLRSRIREELKKIIRQIGITVVFVTHDQQDAKAIADRVVVLTEGKVVSMGTVLEVLGK